MRNIAIALFCAVALPATALSPPATAQVMNCQSYWTEAYKQLEGCNGGGGAPAVNPTINNNAFVGLGNAIGNGIIQMMNNAAAENAAEAQRQQQAAAAAAQAAAAEQARLAALGAAKNNAIRDKLLGELGGVNSQTFDSAPANGPLAVGGIALVHDDTAPGPTTIPTGGTTSAFGINATAKCQAPQDSSVVNLCDVGDKQAVVDPTQMKANAQQQAAPSEKAEIDHDAVIDTVPPPPVVAECKGVHCDVENIDSEASQLLWDMRVWRNDPSHRGWLQDAGTIAMAGLLAPGVATSAAETTGALEAFEGSETVLGAKAAANETREEMVEVTSWGGTDPDLHPGRWVVPGRATWLNYLRSGLWSPKIGEEAPWITWPKFPPWRFIIGEVPGNSITGKVPASWVQWPTGNGAFIKGFFFNQRLIMPP